MVRLIGAQLPVDAAGEPRELIEQIVDAVGVRVSAPRRAHEREGHEKYTTPSRNEAQWGAATALSWAGCAWERYLRNTMPRGGGTRMLMVDDPQA
jgi:hypothetical protein